MRASALALLGYALLAVSPLGCSSPGPRAGGSFPGVSPAPAQSLPAWIDTISPTGEAKDGAQIRVRFKTDVIALDALESPERQAALTHFVMTPALPGRFIFLTPRMAGFEADAPVPHAARVRVTLTSGLTDLKGDKLDADYTWTFTTAPIVLSAIPGANETDDTLDPQNLQPTFALSSNVELDESSLATHVKLVDPADAAKTIAATIVHDASPSPSPGEDASGANPDGQTFAYSLRPASQLAGDKVYKVAIDAGIAPLHGNLPSTKAYAGKLRTYGALGYQGVISSGMADTGGDGRFSGGSPVLTFSNGLDAKIARTSVTVTPAINTTVPLVGIDDGDRTIRINPYALQPRTHYTLTVAATLKDRFGQTLGKPVTATFDTSDYVADIWAPTGLSVFPAGANLQLNVETTNLPEGRYRSAYRTVDPTELITKDPEAYYDSTTFLPPVAGWTWQAAPGKANAPVDTPVALRQKLGGATGMLAYGINAKTIRLRDAKGNLVWQQPVLNGIVQTTDIGIFAQWFPSSGIVRTAHLGDGSPLAGAKVEIYQSLLDSQHYPAPSTLPGTNVPCASGVTDAAGTLNLDSSAFARCASTAKDATSAPELLVVAHNGADWAFVRTLEYSGGYGNGLYGGWSAGTPDPHGTIVSDRSLYQPGETAQFVTVGYFDENGALVRGKATSYDVTIEGPSGRKTPLGSKSLDPFGSFTVSYAIDKHAEVGNYTMRASNPNGESLYGNFRVAEFKPPNFRVDLTLDQQLVTGGASVTASSKSMYLFGAPVEGGRSHAYVTRSRSYYVPKGYDAYDFGRSWYYPEEPPSVDTDVLQKDVTIGSDGTSKLSVPIPGDLPFAMDYRVDSETSDASNLSVSDSKTFTAFPSDALIGLRGDFVATAGTSFSVDAIVTDLKGQPRTDRHLKLVLQRRTFSSATQVVEGSATARDSIHYTDVQTVDLAPGAAPTKATFTAPQAGSYRIRANFSDARSDATATDHDIWISGPGQADWGGDDSGLTVKLDKAIYRPGDAATALVQSPYADADLYFAVIRHGVIYRAIQTVHGPAPQVHFAITADMLPNAAVEAVLVRRGKPLSQSIPTGLGKLARAGFAPFNVALDDKYLNVRVRTSAATLAPGGRQHLSIHLSDRKGRPVSGELALAVVNDAVLNLTGYRFPDLVKIVYADQPISTRFGDSRANVKLITAHKYVDKGFGYGGGAMAGAGSTRVRTQFKALAFWNGALRTDAAGNATVDFQIPDDLTTWRVMALALTQDARFGNGETSFIASKALVTNPILPQFARPGDRFSAGVSITNIGGATGNVSIASVLTGGLVFADNGTRAKDLQAPIAGLTSAYRFDINVTGGQDATVKFTTKLGSNADAFAVPLTVRTGDVLETVALSGATTTNANVPIDVPSYSLTPVGGLDVTLASTLLAEAKEPQAILKEDRPPFATGIASRIAVAADSILLAREFGDDASVPALSKGLASDLDALETATLADGGYAPWPGARHSDVFTTAFVATQLGQAKLAGFDPSGLTHARRFLEARLADPSAECSKNDDRCRASVRLEALETFGTLGDPRSDFLSDIWAHRDGLSYIEQVELARHLVKVAGWHDQGITFRDKLMEQVYESARHAIVNIPGGMETVAAEQAQMLGLMLETHAPADQIDKLVTSLLGQRGRNGQWLCECDDAEALNALVIYASGAGKPSTFTADLTIGSLTGHANFLGASHTVQPFTFPLGGSRGVPAGKSNAMLSKKGDGTLHYSVALRYRAPDIAPGVYSGIRIERRLHPVNDPAILASFGLAPVPADRTHVTAGRVFEIEDRITTDHGIDHVLILDPLPAGFEAVDTGFKTATPYFQAHGDDWQIDYQSIYKDRVLSFAHYLPAGVYAVHYLVRSVTPGSFAWPGAQVSLQFAPEEFGRTASTRLTIDQPK